MEKFSKYMDLANLWGKSHVVSRQQNLLEALKYGQRIFISFDGKNPRPFKPEDIKKLSEEEIFEMSNQLKSFEVLEDDGNESK